MTIEDPIEYQIPGVHQTQVKPSIDLTFASALRSFLRHDPDIMMVGEMRDRDTASIGIQAALTGHLVLTTLHTNNAADAIVRLIDLGVEDFLLVSALRCIVGQRLVRKLCERCRVHDRRDAGLREGISRARACSRHGRASASTSRPAAAGAARRAIAAASAIFEVLRLDATLHSLIRRRADVAQIQAHACAQGMTTMLEDGLAKVRAGITSIEEVLRATS